MKGVKISFTGNIIQRRLDEIIKIVNYPKQFENVDGYYNHLTNESTLNFYDL